MRTVLLILMLGCGQASCAAGSRSHGDSPAASRPAPQPEPEPQETSRIVVTPDETASIDELFADAEALLRDGDAGGAARAFGRVFDLDPDGPRAAEALLAAADAHQAAGESALAVARFEQLARRFPKHPLARRALLGAVRIHAVTDAWSRAGEAARLLLTRYDDLGPIARVVARGGQALALVAAGDLDAASYQIEKGRTVVEQHQLDAAGRLPRDLAPLYFALGEIRRLRAERIQFVPLPKDFTTQLEQRCQLLLDAQSAYSDTMRAYDPHWSAMAGFRVGELYQKLHADLMRIVPPSSADSKARRQLFEGAMRLRYSILLQKALTMMRHTVAMCVRAGERSAWALRAEQATRSIERAIRVEQEAIDRLPYSREQLQAGLDQLAKDKAP